MENRTFEEESKAILKGLEKAYEKMVKFKKEKRNTAGSFRQWKGQTNSFKGYTTENSVHDIRLPSSVLCMYLAVTYNTSELTQSEFLLV